MSLVARRSSAPGRSTRAGERSTVERQGILCSRLAMWRTVADSEGRRGSTTPAVQWVRSRMRRVPPIAADGLLAAALLVLDLAQRAEVIRNEPAASPGSDILGYVLMALFIVPLVLRRRFPLAVLLTILAVMTIYFVLGYSMRGTGEGLLVAAYTLGAHHDLRSSLPGHAGFAGMLAVAVPTARVEVAPIEVVAVVALYTAAYWVGTNVRTRRRYAAELELRAAQLERARQELAQRAVADERLRIARELHDVVAHSMSVIAVQSAAGEHVSERQPEVARQALADIKLTSRAALTEMRRLLGVLRRQGEPVGGLAPLAGLGDVETLARTVDQAGVPVSLEISGERGQVPAAVDLSAYRIVQEALTNVLKHAPAAKASVTVCYGRDNLTVEIRDDGADAAAASRPPPAYQGGNGIVGMRERVALFGGALEAGPVAGGGFRVRARLPYPESVR
jgi:signal transduction histidine kinase